MQMPDTPIIKLISTRQILYRLRLSPLISAKIGHPSAISMTLPTLFAIILHFEFNSSVSEGGVHYPFLSCIVG
jgi:hypothetical protein